MEKQDQLDLLDRIWFHGHEKTLEKGEGYDMTYPDLLQLLHLVFKDISEGVPVQTFEPVKNKDHWEELNRQIAYEGAMHEFRLKHEGDWTYEKVDVTDLPTKRILTLIEEKWLYVIPDIKQPVAEPEKSPKEEKNKKPSTVKPVHCIAVFRGAHGSLNYNYGAFYELWITGNAVSCKDHEDCEYESAAALLRNWDIRHTGDNLPLTVK